jgi:hypothetical protein
MPQVMLHVKEASHLVAREMALDVGIAGESLGEVAVGERVTLHPAVGLVARDAAPDECEQDLLG